MKKLDDNKRRASFLFLLCLCLGFLLVVPAQADVEYLNLTFTDFNQQTVENYDAAPWKGYLSLSVTNNTNAAWGDFHFMLFDFGQYSSQVTFVDGNCAWAKAGAANCNPTKTSGPVDSWNINNSGKNLDLFFYSNPVGIGQTVTFEVYTDNTGNQQPFAVGFTPSIAPEPVSSALFIIGGATLGAGRFFRRKKN